MSDSLLDHPVELALGAVAVLWLLGQISSLQSASGSSSNIAADIGGAIGTGLTSAASGAVTGAVVGVGGLVGIPATNQPACIADQAAGEWWAASFDCPATTFVPAAASAAGSVAANAQSALAPLVPFL